MLSRRVLSIALFLALLGPFAAAQCPPGVQCRNLPTGGWRAPSRPMAELRAASKILSQDHDATFRVVIHDKNGYQSYQTGCLVRNRDGEDFALVATSAHGFTGDSTKIVIYTPTVGGFDAIIKRVDHTWDIAILAIRRPRVAAFLFPSRRPTIREPLTLGGYIGGKAMGWAKGALTGWAGPVGDYPMDLLVISATTSNGQSGGPIIDSSGRLAGLVSGDGGEGDTIGTGWWQIQIAIDQALAPIDVAEETPIRPPLVPVDPPTGEPHPDLAAILVELAALRLTIEQMEMQPGPPGEPGPPGPPGGPGAAGNDGDDGVSPTIDIDDLTAQVLERIPAQDLPTIDMEDLVEAVIEALPPLFEVQFVDEVTGEETIEEISLGEGFTIFNSTPQ